MVQSGRCTPGGGPTMPRALASHPPGGLVRVSLRAFTCRPWASSGSYRLRTRTASPPLTSSHSLQHPTCGRAGLLETGRGAAEVSGGEGSFPSGCCLPEPVPEQRAPHPTWQAPLLTGRVHAARPRASGPGYGVSSVLSCQPLPEGLSHPHCSVTLRGATLFLASSPVFLASPSPPT